MKITSCLLLLLCAIAKGQAQESDAFISSKIDSVRKAHNIPAIVAAVIKPDKSIYGIGGTTRINGSDTVELFRKFHLGSNTKAITSFIAMRLVESNALRLDSKLRDIVPELSAVNDSYQNITLGDLLSHNAGIQPYTSGQEYNKLPAMSGTVSEKRLAFAEFVLQETAVKKGTYSNAGYAIAALMLEKASGKTYEELVRQLADTLQIEYYAGFPNSEDVQNPWGHWMEGGALEALSPDHFYRLVDYMCPAGDLSMNIIDYSDFLRLHLRGLLGDDNVLTSKSYHTLHFGLPGHGYGWGNVNTGTGNVMSFHDGSAGTYYCHTVLIPGKRIGITLMMNSAEDDHIEALYRLRDILLMEYTKLSSGMEDQGHSEGFSISPNPASDKIQISVPETVTGCTIKLINNLGVVVYSGSAVQSPVIHLNPAEFPGGIYRAVLSSPAKTYTKTLVIQR